MTNLAPLTAAELDELEHYYEANPSPCSNRTVAALAMARRSLAASEGTPVDFFAAGLEHAAKWCDGAALLEMSKPNYTLPETTHKAGRAFAYQRAAEIIRTLEPTPQPDPVKAAARRWLDARNAAISQANPTDNRATFAALANAEAALAMALAQAAAVTSIEALNRIDWRPL